MSFLDDNLPDTVVKLTTMNNQAMLRKLSSGEAIDVADAPRNEEGDYILFQFFDGKDYCDSKTESWIWSIGRHRETNQILASTSTRFYQNEEYECLFLR